MKHEFAYEEAQRHLKQRNRFAALAGLLGLTTVLAVGAAATRDDTLVLVCHASPGSQTAGTGQ